MNTPTLSSIPQDIDKVLEEVTHKIVDIFHPEQIILFGSYAYGTPTRDRDIDLLVIMNTEDRPSERSLRITQVCRPRYVSEDFRTAITMVRKCKDPVPDNVCFCAQQCVWTGYPRERSRKVKGPVILSGRLRVTTSSSRNPVKMAGRFLRQPLPAAPAWC